MAKFEFDFTEFTQQLNSLNYDRICNALLETAVPILQKYVKAETSKHKLTGNMFESIKPQKRPSKSKDGTWRSAVLPTGTDEKGVRNMEKMAYLEYGTSKMPAKPILTKAVNDAADEINAAMRKVMETIGETK